MKHTIDNINYTSIFYSVISILFGIILGFTTAFIRKFLNLRKKHVLKVK